MPINLAGSMSDQKEKNRFSGVQRLAWTWGEEGGPNLDFLYLESVRMFLLIWALAGPMSPKNKKILTRASGI